MLVLSRKRNEEIVIGESVVKILEIRRGIVRIGIEAPKTLKIERTGGNNEQPAIAGKTK